MTSLLKTTVIQEPSSSTANITLDATGNVTVNNNMTASQKLNSFTSVTAPVKLPAGTSTSAPLNLDYVVPYTTTAGQFSQFICYPQTGQQSTLDLSQTYADDFFPPSFTNTTSANSWLGYGSPGNGVNLSSNSIYSFEGNFVSKKTVGASLYTFSTSFGGTATLNWVNYNLYRTYSTSGFTEVSNVPSSGFIQTASSTTTESSAGASTAYRIYMIKGMVSVNAGGTFIPSASVTLATANIAVETGSYFVISLLGSAGANVSIGPWA